MIDITKIKVRGYHIDSYGHVNNTRYLEFLEEARWNIKDRHLQFFNQHDEKYGLVVVNNNINYKASAFLGNELKIESQVIKIGTKSVIFQHDIFTETTNLHIISAKVTFVFFNRYKNQSEHIPDELRKNLKNLTKKKEP